MILGDPFAFSVFIQTISAWNDSDTFRNGVLLFGVDGVLFPKSVINVTLAHELPLLKQNLENIAVDPALFSAGKEATFKEMYSITFPEDWSADNDYRFDITPDEFADHNCHIFAVGDGRRVRFLAAEPEYDLAQSRHCLENLHVSEAFLSLEELSAIVSKLRIY